MELDDDNTKCMCNNDSVLLLGMVACSRNVKTPQQCHERVGIFVLGLLPRCSFPDK